MESHNKGGMYVAIVVVAVVAFVLGGVWQSRMSTKSPVGRNAHQMSDGTIMNNDDMGMSASPMSMRQMMDSMSSSLEGKTGNDFDAAFLEEMIPHHQGAVAMAEMVLKTSKRPELIKLANDIIASQQKEIDQMRAWQRTWFGVQPQ